ncbi:MAG: methylglyoxal synthase [Myxococcales bacterium]
MTKGTIKGTITQPLEPDGPRPVLALVAHDGRKEEMAEWAAYNQGTLSRCGLWATQTTGKTLQAKLALNIHLLLSGPLGGDAQLGTLIAEGRVDVVIFFWDPLTSQPHDVDVKALLRLAVLHDVPIACNRSTADYLISSPLFAVPVNYREARGQQGPGVQAAPESAGS